MYILMRWSKAHLRPPALGATLKEKNLLLWGVNLMLLLKERICSLGGANCFL